MEIFSSIWKTLNGNVDPWFGNLANALQIFDGLLLPIGVAIIGWIGLRLRRRQVASPQPRPEPEPQPEPEPEPQPAPNPPPGDDRDLATASPATVDPTDDRLLRKYDLLLTNYTPGKKFAIRSLDPPPPISFGLFLFVLWAEGMTFLFVLAASNEIIALTACVVVSIYLRFRWDHGTVIEINHDKRRIWIIREYTGFGGGIWPPQVAFDISYDHPTKRFCATVSLQGHPIVRATNLRRERLEKKFVPLVSYLNSLATLPAGRSWRFGWGGPGS
jgi:hypothetical protein